MTTIVILIAYWFDYRSNKKQFVSDLKGGLLFLLLLFSAFNLMYFMLNLGILYAILAIGVGVPISLFVKHFLKR